jgi:hypothetical protein
MLVSGERAGTTPPTQAELFDAAVRLGHVLEPRDQHFDRALCGSELDLELCDAVFSGLLAIAHARAPIASPVSV